MSALERPAAWDAVPLAMRSASRSHVGLVRQINEDRVFDWAGGGVWAVVDGMGGHRGGDLAAQSVVDALRMLTGAGPASPATILKALERANAAIFARNAECGESAGATVVTLGLQGAAAHIAWAGDSRCYRVRDGRAALLTRDHSVVQDLVDAGLLSPERAVHHPQANVITRALGVDPSCAIDSRLVDVAAGDRFLLCSDGLSRSLRDDEPIAGEIDAVADRLLAAALDRDGTDNISLILIEPDLR